MYLVDAHVGVAGADAHELRVEALHPLGGVQRGGGGAGAHRVAADGGPGVLDGDVLREPHDATQQLRKPWKQDIADELRNAFSSEMYVTAAEHSPHENKYWDWAHEEAQLVREAEKRGKVIRPRVDGGREEDEIR